MASGIKPEKHSRAAGLDWCLDEKNVHGRPMRHPALFFILFSSIFSQAKADEIQKFSLMDQGRLVATSQLAAIAPPKDCPLQLLGRCYSPVASFQPVAIRKSGQWADGWVE